ncbi:MAG: 50S ribosomal protein L30 [Gammaproteobacteria bacterium]
MAKAKQANQHIKIKLIKSLSGRKPNHIACAHGLGLRKIGQTVEVIDTPENRGMVNQIPYLVSLEG